MNRRSFVKTGAAGIAGLAGASLVEAAQNGRKVGPNDKLTVAVVGTNGRGMAHVECFTALPDAEITYICDVDERAIAKGVKGTTKVQRNEPKGLKDFRRALEDPSLDAVAIASPDHWHTPMAMLALAAGKHVYLEKPLSHNPYEGEMLIKSVRKYGKVLQMGAQRRSFPNIQQAIKDIHGGLIGKAYFARTWYANNRAAIGKGKPAGVPAWLDYDLWQGPAPRRDFKDNVVHYNWHWFWNWGTGEALNNGTHEVDVARWALGASWPERVSSNGGRYHFQDDWETPDTQVVTFDFPAGKTITWEGRSCNGYPSEGLARGVMIYGTEGTALLDSNSYTFWDKKKKVIKQAKEEAAVDATNTLSATGMKLDLIHVKNFTDCVRSGARPNCPVEEGHNSTAILQIGNIAQRVNRALHLDTTNGHIKNDAEAMKLWRREYEKGWEPKV